MAEVNRRLRWPQFISWHDHDTGDNWSLSLRKGRGLRRLCAWCHKHCTAGRCEGGCGQQARFAGTVARHLRDGSIREDQAEIFVCYCCASKNSRTATPSDTAAPAALPGMAARSSASAEIHPPGRGAAGAVDQGSEVRWPWQDSSWIDMPAPAQPDDLAGMLATKEDEAQQNWTALIETRAVLSKLRSELESAQVTEQRLRNRLRRLRSGYSEQRESLKAFDHAELEDLRNRAAEAERRTVEALAQGADTQVQRLIGKARAVATVLKLANDRLDTISIPMQVADSASRQLDVDGYRKARARAVASALMALHAYAVDRSRQGDFRQWCVAGGSKGVSYSANRVAMAESVSVKRVGRHAHARTFPVDRLLDVSGSRQMLAHIKLDQGPTAPRLYFHDDTHGKTGKIHIGYIGPHLPTANDPT